MFSKRFLYSLLILLFSLPMFVNAQTQEVVADSIINTDDVHDEESSVSDQTTINEEELMYIIRNIPADSLTAIRKDKAYAYMRNLDSLLREQNKELKAALENQRNMTDKSTARREFSFDAIRFLLWILATAALLFLVYSIFLSNSSLFRTNRKNIDASFEKTEEDENDDLSNKKRKAIQSGNYRLAVRYAYLELLQFLDDKKIIEIRTDKTNYQYVMEMSSQQWANAFAGLTLKYEYIWYGKYEIDKNRYDQIEVEFNGLKQKIK